MATVATKTKFYCPYCQKEIIEGWTWMGNCSGCKVSVNFCKCKFKKPKDVSEKDWKDRLVWQAIYATGRFKWDDGCLDDEGLALQKKIQKIYE